jgi:hypothetical protein
VKRRHRVWHRRLWSVLPLMLALLVVAAIAVRPPAPPQGRVAAP